MLLGAEPVSQMINQVPATIIAGFSASGNLLPAIGMAMLFKMLWNKKLNIFFLLGFILVSYLGLDMVGTAAFGIVLIVAIALKDIEQLNIQNKLKKEAVLSGGADENVAEEEAFFA